MLFLSMDGRFRAFKVVQKCMLTLKVTESQEIRNLWRKPYCVRRFGYYLYVSEVVLNSFHCLLPLQICKCIQNFFVQQVSHYCSAIHAYMPTYVTFIYQNRVLPSKFTSYSYFYRFPFTSCGVSQRRTYTAKISRTVGV